jgi:hypothetical protein
MLCVSEDDLKRGLESFMSDHSTQECHYTYVGDMRTAGIKVVL